MENRTSIAAHSKRGISLSTHVKKKDCNGIPGKEERQEEGEPGHRFVWKLFVHDSWQEALKSAAVVECRRGHYTHPLGDDTARGRSARLVSVDGGTSDNAARGRAARLVSVDGGRVLRVDLDGCDGREDGGVERVHLDKVFFGWLRGSSVMMRRLVEVV